MKTTWLPEIKFYLPKVPIIVVGLKKDLRTDPISLEYLKSKNLTPLTPEEGIKITKEIKGKNYRECSSLSSESIDLVFSAAVEAVNQKRKKRGFFRSITNSMKKKK